MMDEQWDAKSITIIIPTFNEEASIQPLGNQIISVMEESGYPHFEILFIDDGSTDNSWEKISELVDTHSEKIKGIQFRKNFGKSAALMVGFKEAEGKIILTMDADLQDDPKEIPRFIQELGKGFDLVSGWKKKRCDPLSKTIPSKLFNKVTSLISGISLSDFNCGFKAYRSEAVHHIELYGELHRFIPLLVAEYGYKIGELEVTHHPRSHGHSKFGMERYLRGFLDLLTVITITRYLQRPGHLFGGIGVLFGVFGMTSTFYLIILWFLGFRPIGNRPLLLFGIMATLISIQLILFGLLSELTIRGKGIGKVSRMIKQKKAKPDGSCHTV